MPSHSSSSLRSPSKRKSKGLAASSPNGRDDTHLLVTDPATVAMLHDRRLLNQVKQGRGNALKGIRQYLDDNPQLGHRQKATRAVEEQNEHQRRNMMWVKDAKSQTARVEGSFRDQCTYTSILSTSSTVPNPHLVAKGTENLAKQYGGAMGNGDPSCGSQNVVVPQGMLPLPSLVNELAAERATKLRSMNHHAARSSLVASQQQQQQSVASRSSRNQSTSTNNTNSNSIIAHNVLPVIDSPTKAAMLMSKKVTFSPSGGSPIA